MSSAFERAQISEDWNSHFNNVTQNTPYPVCHDMQVENNIELQTIQYDNAVTHSQLKTVHENSVLIVNVMSEIKNKHQTQMQMWKFFRCECSSASFNVCDKEPD